MIADYLLYDLIDKFPNEKIYMFPIRGKVQDFVLVMPPAGIETYYYTNGVYEASMIVQKTDSREAIETAFEIYDHYRDQINYVMELPTNVLTNLPRKLTLTYIKSKGMPLSLGDIGGGQYQYSINLNMTIGGYK